MQSDYAEHYPSHKHQLLLSSHASYRDRIYIIKDIILKLVEYGELNQTALTSFCGLNLSKHRVILDHLESRGLISRETVNSGKKRSVTIYKPTRRGIDFCKIILEPYERMFPRTSDMALSKTQHYVSDNLLENS